MPDAGIWYPASGTKYQGEGLSKPAAFDGNCWRLMSEDRRRLFHGSVQADFEPRTVKAKPTTAATRPPMSIQTALSVGEPVKNRDTSELKEFVALMPKIMRTTPPTRRPRETIRFIARFE
jgi:hypothetical protein